MPRPRFPPTPASSMDIVGKDEAIQQSLEISFSLPPPALGDSNTSTRSSISSTKASSESSYRPTSPLTPTIVTRDGITNSHRCPTTISKSGKDFALPPPPTRSRKIIQVKPKSRDSQLRENNPVVSKSDTKNGAGVNTSTAAGNKRKQPSSTSAAGKKIARKTAHSLIERRRRSKMNEEFATLKDMIPACKGQEMHKLAILQASIEYLHYLEQCVLDLKAENSRQSSTPSLPQSPATHSTPTQMRSEDEDEEDGEDEDTEMSDSRPVSPLTSVSRVNFHHRPGRNQTPLAFYSPNIMDQDQNSDSFPPPSLPSPTAGPQSCTPIISQSHSALTSSVLLPCADNTGRDMTDHEATAALLMLNKDRRSTIGSSNSSGAPYLGGRAMSVQDLLSL
ncbi:MAG: hypothetical protein M1834_008165 [Cirrosporium novae-zelandiae]|nr:MAG: hypothetical protein M1834_008165 [Cirrosporium novae-zelandiae]